MIRHELIGQTVKVSASTFMTKGKISSPSGTPAIKNFNRNSVRFQAPSGEAPKSRNSIFDAYVIGFKDYAAQRLEPGEQPLERRVS